MKKKLYLLLAICSICLFALVACTDNSAEKETENTTQGPTDNEKNSNGVDTPTQTDATNGTDDTNETNDTNGIEDNNNTDENNGTNNADDDGIIDDIEDGVDDVNDEINDATDDN